MMNVEQHREVLTVDKQREAMTVEQQGEVMNVDQQGETMNMEQQGEVMNVEQQREVLKRPLGYQGETGMVVKKRRVEEDESPWPDGRYRLIYWAFQPCRLERQIDRWFDANMRLMSMLGTSDHMTVVRGLFRLYCRTIGLISRWRGQVEAVWFRSRESHTLRFQFWNGHVTLMDLRMQQEFVGPHSSQVNLNKLSDSRLSDLFRKWWGIIMRKKISDRVNRYPLMVEVANNMRLKNSPGPTFSKTWSDWKLRLIRLEDGKSSGYAEENTLESFLKICI